MIEALYFDGRSGRAQQVRLQVSGGRLHAVPAAAAADAPDAPTVSWPLAQVQWPERTRHGQRVLHLADGSSLQVADAQAFDAWRRDGGHADSWVVRAQQNWRATLAAVAGLALVAIAGYVWGVPWAARAVLVLVPPGVDQAVGAAALERIDTQWLAPTTLPAPRQDALRQAFAAATRQAYGDGGVPPHTLRFAAADKALGPNAFALPGGTIVVTDALVELLQGHDDTLVGVMAHELGHVRHRHGMRAWVQLVLVGAATAAVLGDFSSLLAGVPALVAQLGYSRDAEREADAEAARVLRASGHSPAVMTVLFDRLAAARSDVSALPIALASHPADEERVRYFREAAAAR
jgi:Zn-dependent protease with chaperone function